MANEPWTQTTKWKNESAFWVWLRGQLRKSVWSNYIPRIEFIDEEAKLISSYSEETQLEIRQKIGNRAKYACKCALCNEWFPKSALQVDHNGETAGAIKSWETATKFTERLCCHKDNMQLVCEPCHEVKSYADRWKLTFEQAKEEKIVIEYGNKKAQEQKTKLLELGIKPAGNEEERINQYRNYIKGKQQ